MEKYRLIERESGWWIVKESSENDDRPFRIISNHKTQEEAQNKLEELLECLKTK